MNYTLYKDADIALTREVHYEGYYSNGRLSMKSKLLQLRYYYTPMMF